MSNLTIKTEHMDALIAEVQNALEPILKAEQEKLAKAHPGEETPPEVPADDSATSGTKSAGGEDDATVSASPPASSDGPPAAPPAASASPEAPPAGGPGDASATGDPAADDTNSPDALAAEYMKLGQTDPEALKSHYIACKQALMSLMGSGDPAATGDPAAAAPPAPPVAAPAGPPAASATPAGPPDAPPALKAEMPSNPANGGKELPVKKSEQEVQFDELKVKLTKTEEVVSGLLKVVEKIATTPVRKSFKSSVDLAKSEGAPKVDVSSLTPEQIKEKLKIAAENPKLSKSDRGLIYKYAVKMVDVEKIAHLLT